jgi:hypothetical protein
MKITALLLAASATIAAHSHFARAEVIDCGTIGSGATIPPSSHSPGAFGPSPNQTKQNIVEATTEDECDTCPEDTEEVQYGGCTPGWGHGPVAPVFDIGPLPTTPASFYGTIQTGAQGVRVYVSCGEPCYIIDSQTP